MSHDPLCPRAQYAEPDIYCCPACDGIPAPWQVRCQCDLIAAVRADERRRYVAGLDRIIREVDTPPQQPKEHINPTGYDPAATDSRP